LIVESEDYIWLVKLLLNIKIGYLHWTSKYLFVIEVIALLNFIYQKHACKFNIRLFEGIIK